MRGSPAILVLAGRAVAARAAVGAVEVLHLDDVGRHDALKNELRHTVATLD